MSRRVSSPGADELFRTTGGWGSRRPLRGDWPTARPGRRRRRGRATRPPPRTHRSRCPRRAVTARARSTARRTRNRARRASRAAGRGAPGAGLACRAWARRKLFCRRPAAQAWAVPSRRPSGRERHDEKITVYVSAEELMDLEHARLVLRAKHGLAVDRAASSARRSPWSSPIWRPAGTPASSYDGCAGASGSLRGP